MLLQAVKWCTGSFTGALTLTLAVIKLHYVNNTLWSSYDSPVLWHPGRREHLAATCVLAGLEVLGRSRYCRECPAALTAAFWAGWARQGWIPEQRLDPLAWTHGHLWVVQRTMAGICQGPQRETKSFGFEDIAYILLIIFLHPLVFLVRVQAQQEPCMYYFQLNHPKFAENLVQVWADLVNHAHCREYCMAQGKARERGRLSKQLPGVVQILLLGDT